MPCKLCGGKTLDSVPAVDEDQEKQKVQMRQKFERESCENLRGIMYGVAPYRGLDSVGEVVSLMESEVAKEILIERGHSPREPSAEDLKWEQAKKTLKTIEEIIEEAERRIGASSANFLALKDRAFAQALLAIMERMEG